MTREFAKLLAAHHFLILPGLLLEAHGGERSEVSLMRVRAHLHARVFPSFCACSCVFVYVCVHVYAGVCVHERVYERECVRVRVRVHALRNICNTVQIYAVSILLREEVIRTAQRGDDAYR